MGFHVGMIHSSSQHPYQSLANSHRDFSYMHFQHLMNVRLPDFIQELETVLRAEQGVFARCGVKYRVQRLWLKALVTACSHADSRSPRQSAPAFTPSSTSPPRDDASRVVSSSKDSGGATITIRRARTRTRGSGGKGRRRKFCWTRRRRRRRRATVRKKRRRRRRRTTRRSRRRTTDAGL